MIWAISMTSALAAFLTVMAISQAEATRPGKKQEGRPAENRLLALCHPLIHLLGAINAKLPLHDYERNLRRRLLYSGNRLELEPMEFLAIKELCAVAGTCCGLLMIFSLEAPWLALLPFGGLGFFLPDLSMARTTRQRKKEIFLALPFSMDLMALAMEAGLNFTLALEQVVRKSPTGPLNLEFERVLRDMRLGLTMSDALGSLAERVDMYEIRSLATALIQAERLGTPLAAILQTQADIRRTERFQRAEKLAQEAPVKMLFPLIFFIFPAVFIMLLTPVILKFLSEGM